MAYHRGHPLDYDDWARAGNTGWDWASVLPLFRRTENNADVRNPQVHGLDGAIHVQHIRKPNSLNFAFLDAFAEVGGYRRCDDFTGLDPEGYGLRQGTIHRGRRALHRHRDARSIARAPQPHAGHARAGSSHKH